MFDEGVKVTVSSDDPLFLGSNVTAEIAIVHDLLGFDQKELIQLAKNAIDASFQPLEKKRGLHWKLTERHNIALNADG